MLTTVEAEINVDGSIRLLEPIKVGKKSRAILTLLNDENGGRKQISAEEERLAEARFARHFGSVSSGDPHSCDNEKIDAELAREYEDTHDDE